MNTFTNTSPVSPKALQESDLQEYRQMGYLVIPKLVDEEYLGAMREEVLYILEAKGCSEKDLYESSGKSGKLIQSSQYLRGSLLDQLINGDATLGLASQLIGGQALRYLPFTAVKSAGGGGQFHFHQDNNYTQHEPALGSINIWVALVDMSEENGCLMVVPGSHDRQWPSRSSDDGDSHQQIDVDEKDRVPVVMKAGDAVAFTRWTVHGSGVNRSEQPRIAYALQYHREDVCFKDPESKELKRLKDHERWSTYPLETLV